MLAIAVRFLTGRAVAASLHDRDEPEWPIHPARLFMALAAALYRDGANVDAQQRHALEWLERQGAPTMAVPPHSKRTVVTSYVPVNDTAEPGDSPPFGAHVALGRARQPRSFPSVTVGDAELVYSWPNAHVDEPTRAGLAQLCSQATYLGHSSSLVCLRLVEASPTPTLVPRESGGLTRLRVPGPGRLAELDATFALGRRPSAGLFLGYGPPEVLPERPRSVLGDLFVLRRVGGVGLDIISTQQITAALRNALMRWGPQPSPEILTGHDHGGRPTKRAHAATISLPDVGHAHADGHLLGAAVAVPRNAPDHEVSHVVEALARFVDATGGRGELRMPAGTVVLQVEDREGPPIGLRTVTWCGPARRWATVTPIVLDRFPKRDGDAERIVSDACAQIGLPVPREVVIAGASLHEGVPLAREFPPHRAKPGQQSRLQRHAVVTFDTAVEGPIMLGAGRFRGLGLLRPLLGEA